MAQMNQQSWGGHRERGVAAAGKRLRALLLAGACLAGLVAGARGEVVDRVIATVDDEAILLSEVESRVLAELASLQVAESDTAAVREVREQVREGLIEQRLLAKEAQTRAIEAPEEEITQAVEDAIARNKEQLGSEAAFREQLDREGLTEDDLRARFAIEARREILAARLVQSELHDKVTIAPGEVKQYYDEHLAELPQRETLYKLQRIVWMVQPDSLTLARTRQLAENVAGQIRAGLISFADAARRYSDDPNGKSGGDLLQIKRGDLAGRLGDAFEEQAFALAPNTVSAPLLTPFGYHLLWVSERDPQGAWIHLSHILFGVPTLKADAERARAQAEAVLVRLQAGESFDELARRNSQAPEATEGGTLGWVPLGAMDPALQAAVQALSPGEFSGVVELQGAFLILRLEEREEARPYRYEEIEQDLDQWVRSRKMEALYTEWVAGLKPLHHIERRPWE
jgi:peptidyl-prolyl cis-trans isomerase SurA